MIVSSDKDINSENIKCKPFLRWAGGKSRIVKYLIRLSPPRSYENYWEPFLGAGSLFFGLAPRKSVISDSNLELINCYKAIKDHPNMVMNYLGEHINNNSEEYYYAIRDEFNHSKPSIKQSARFIYLNRAGFNGIFRVNKSGKYNVPYGHKDPPPVATREDILLASLLMKNAELISSDYQNLFSSRFPEPGDFIYLDPPYPPINSTSQFNHYTESRFSWDDQKKISIIANQLKARNCLIMISNLDTVEIRDLYCDWNFHPLPVIRWIAANGSRKEVNELVITNY